MSAKMYTLRVDLPGPWTDGWLYKDHLILWSRTGQMYVTPFADLVAAVRKKLDWPPLDVVADYLIFRNDWKASEQFERIRLIPGVESSFLADFNSTAGEIVVSIDSINQIPALTDEVPGVVLDAAIYANRVYVGSTDGLFETRFDPNIPHSKHPLVGQLENTRVRSVTAWYSAVNSSAGEDGLLFFRMSFDEDRPWWNEKTSFRRVAEFSRGNSFADVNLLNYTNDAFPVFMHSQTVKEGMLDNQESDRRQITGYSGTTEISGLVESFLRSRRPSYGATLFDDEPTEGVIAVLGNSGNRMLVNWNDSLRVLDLSLGRGRGLSVKRDREFRDVSSISIDPLDILDTYAFGKGFLVELPDEVRLINYQGSFSLLAEPVARIRTFPHSRRHREVILLVRENGVSLLGYYIAQEPLSSAY